MSAQYTSTFQEEYSAKLPARTRLSQLGWTVLPSPKALAILLLGMQGLLAY